MVSLPISGQGAHRQGGTDRPLQFLADHLTDPAPTEISVLHVDDEPEFLEMASSYLEHVDDTITVHAETDAEAALERYLREPETIDCIVSDYQMPGMDGLDLLEAVRARDPDVPFILFTGKGSEVVAADAIAAGVTEYMQKAVGSEHYRVLANRIANAVRQYRTDASFWTILSWYQRLCEQTLAGTYLIQDRAFVYVNPTLARMFGYEQDELVGEDVLTLVDETEHDAVVERFRRRTDGEVDDIRYRLTGRKKDGSRIDVEAHGGVIEFNGEPAVLGVLTEVCGGGD